MRKLLAAVLLAAALTTISAGVAQAGDHPKPGSKSRVCTNEASISVAQCTRVDVSPEVNVPELGVGDVVDDLTDTVTDLVGGVL